jgi:hypothetical protein
MAPDAIRGYWQGRSRFVQNLGMSIGPLIFSAILGDSSDTATANSMLYACGAVSFFAALLYVPYLKMFPKMAKPDAGLSDESIERDALLSEEEWGTTLSLEKQDRSNLKRFEKGLPLYVRRWGSDDAAERTDLRSRRGKVHNNLVYFHKMTSEYLVDNDKLQKLADATCKSDQYDPAVMGGEEGHAEAVREMGAWMAKYFEAAGYFSWASYPEVYKTAIVNQFPPVHKFDRKECSKRDMEAALLDMLKVLDIQLKTDEQQAMYSGWQRLGQFFTKFPGISWLVK